MEYFEPPEKHSPFRAKEVYRGAARVVGQALVSYFDRLRFLVIMIKRVQ